MKDKERMSLRESGTEEDEHKPGENGGNIT